MKTTFMLESPITGEKRSFEATPSRDLVTMAPLAQEAFLLWRDVPAPARGDLIREFGNVLRENLDELAEIITEESGKIVSEAMGEV